MSYFLSCNCCCKCNFAFIVLCTHAKRDTQLSLNLSVWVKVELIKKQCNQASRRRPGGDFGVVTACSTGTEKLEARGSMKHFFSIWHPGFMYKVRATFRHIHHIQYVNFTLYEDQTSPRDKQRILNMLYNSMQPVPERHNHNFTKVALEWHHQIREHNTHPEQGFGECQGCLCFLLCAGRE